MEMFSVTYKTNQVLGTIEKSFSSHRMLEHTHSVSKPALHQHDSIDCRWVIFWFLPEYVRCASSPARRIPQRGLMGMLRAFLMLCFQPTHIQMGEIFTTKCFESQKSKLVQKTITKPHERQVHQKLLITMTQMKSLTHDSRTEDFIASRRIQPGKGHLYLDLVLDF